MVKLNKLLVLLFFVIFLSFNVLAYQGKIYSLSPDVKGEDDNKNSFNRADINITFSNGDILTTTTDNAGQYAIDTNQIFCWDGCNLVPEIKGKYLTINEKEPISIEYTTSNYVNNFRDYGESILIDNASNKYQLEKVGGKVIPPSNLPEFNGLFYYIEYNTSLNLLKDKNYNKYSLNAYWLEIDYDGGNYTFYSNNTENQDFIFDLPSRANYVHFKYLFYQDGNKPNLKAYDPKKDKFLILPREAIIEGAGSFISKITSVSNHNRKFAVSSLISEPSLPTFSLTVKCQILESQSSIQNPIVLVHGLHGDEDNYWGNIPLKFSDEGFKVYQVQYTPANGDNRYNAYLLKQCIDDVKQNVPSSKVNLIAHSMGGIVARVYTSNLGRDSKGNNVSYSGDVQNLVTIGSPLYGSAASNKLIEGDVTLQNLYNTISFFTHSKYSPESFNEPAYRDLSTGSAITWNLNDIGLNDSIRYLAIAGIANDIILANWFHYEAKDSDFVVSASSASLRNFGVSLVLLQLNHANEHGKSYTPVFPNCNAEVFGLDISSCNIKPLVNGISAFLKGSAENSVKSSFSLKSNEYYISPNNHIVSDTPPINEGMLLIKFQNDSFLNEEVKLKMNNTIYPLKRNIQTNVFYHYNAGESNLISCIASRIGQLNFTIEDVNCLSNIAVAYYTGDVSASLLSCVNSQLVNTGVTLVTDDLEACLTKPIDYGLTLPQGIYTLYINNISTGFDVEVKPLQTNAYEINFSNNQSYSGTNATAPSEGGSGGGMTTNATAPSEGGSGGGGNCSNRRNENASICQLTISIMSPYNYAMYNNNSIYFSLYANKLPQWIKLSLDEQEVSYICSVITTSSNDSRDIISNCTNGVHNLNFLISNMSEGDHTANFYFSDFNNNVSNISIKFGVDTVLPAIGLSVKNHIWQNSSLVGPNYPLTLSFNATDTNFLAAYVLVGKNLTKEDFISGLKVAQIYMNQSNLNFSWATKTYHLESVNLSIPVFVIQEPDATFKVQGRLCTYSNQIGIKNSQASSNKEISGLSIIASANSNSSSDTNATAPSEATTPSEGGSGGRCIYTNAKFNMNNLNFINFTDQLNFTTNTTFFYDAPNGSSYEIPFTDNFSLFVNPIVDNENLDLMIISEDYANNIKVISSGLIIDSSSPLFQNLSLHNNTNIGRFTSFIVNLNESHQIDFNNTKINILLNGNNFYNYLMINISEQQLQINITKPSNGDYSITIIPVDLANNTGSPISLVVHDINGLEDINTNLQNISLVIGNSTNLSQTFFGIQNVSFTQSNTVVLSYVWNYSYGNLDLSNISVIKEDANAAEGSLIISGIDLTSQSQTKVVYLDKISSTTNKICIKDAEVASITQISTNCDGANEVSMPCPGTSGQYTCELIDDNTRYKISGLSHSGVKEYTFVSLPPQNNNQNNGGGGGGGTTVAITLNNTLNKTENVINATNLSSQILFANKSEQVNNETGTNSESNQTKSENKGRSFITGAVVGVRNVFKNYGLYTLVVILLLISSWFGIKVLRARKDSLNQTKEKTFVPLVKFNIS